MRHLSDGEREVMAEANDDAYEAEMAWLEEEREEEEWAGNFVSPEAERALVDSIFYEIESNAMSADWTHVGDDDEDECPW